MNIQPVQWDMGYGFESISTQVTTVKAKDIVQVPPKKYLPNDEIQLPLPW
jgi:hypothetical protein